MARKSPPRRPTPPPIASDSRWQVDVVPLPAVLTPQDVAGEASVVLVVEAAQGFVRMVEIGVTAAMPGPLSSALRMAAESPMPPATAGWPAAIEVRDEAVAAWIAQSGLPGEIRVELCDELPAMQAALQALFERMIPPAPAVYDDALEPALLRLAARLVEVAPWRGYSNLVYLELSGGASAPRYPIVGILGAAGEVFGLSFHETLEVPRAMLATSTPVAIEGLVLWFFDTHEVSPADRSAFAAAGYSRLDLYPRVDAIVSGERHAATAAERSELRRAVEAVLAFVEQHPQAPPQGTEHTVQLPQRRGSGGALTVRVHHLEPPGPALRFVDAHLEPMMSEAAIFDISLEAGTVRSFDRASLEGQELPAQVPVLVVRSTKQEIVRAMRRMEALSVVGIGPVAQAACAHCGTDEEIPTLALLDAAGEPVASLFDGDEELFEALESMAQSCAGRLVVVLSGGGTRRLGPGVLRAVDVLGVRAWEWRR